MALSANDLYEIAKLFFPQDWSAVTLHDFLNDEQRQYVVLKAIHEFAKGDSFFKAIGDQPMPSFSRPKMKDIIKMFKSLAAPATVEERIKSNAILRGTVGRAYRPWWMNPELYVH